MKVIKRYKTAYERQIGESVLINLNLDEGTDLLNSRNEYNRCLIPRLTIEEERKDEFERMKEERIERETKNKIADLKSIKRDGRKERQAAKRQRRDSLKVICEEIISFNDAKWNLRRRREIEEREKENLKEQERKLRLEKAEIKRHTLLEKIERRGMKEKRIRDREWIKKRTEGWRKFRDKSEMKEEEERSFWNNVMEAVPVRESKNETETFLTTPVVSWIKQPKLMLVKEASEIHDTQHLQA